MSLSLYTYIYIERERNIDVSDVILRTMISTPTPTTEPHVCSILRADLSVRPQRLCHTRGAIVGLGGEILVARYHEALADVGLALRLRELLRPIQAVRYKS